MLKINEIFWSFQGEGMRAGFPAIFIRFAGCSLHCPYCDSKNSWEKCVSVSMEDILSEVDRYRKKYPLSQVVITGGEPLEQNLSAVATEIKNRNLFLALETNGLHYQDLPVDWWTVSPKDGTGYTIQRDLVKKIDEVKLIVNKNLTIDVIKKIREKIKGKEVPVFLQPEGNDKSRYKNTFLLFQRCQEQGLENVKAGIQLHNVYDVK